MAPKAEKWMKIFAPKRANPTIPAFTTTLAF
jgi:hypothetical protein